MIMWECEVGHCRKTTSSVDSVAWGTKDKINFPSKKKGKGKRKKKSLVFIELASVYAKPSAVCHPGGVGRDVGGDGRGKKEIEAM